MKNKKEKKKGKKEEEEKTLCIGNAVIPVTILRQKKCFSTKFKSFQKSKIRLVNEKC